jgi:hypothetical protein
MNSHPGTPVTAALCVGEYTTYRCDMKDEQ